MDKSLLQELLTAKDSAEKASITAEYFFSDLPEETICAARQCTLFHWFDSSVIEALLQETSLTKDEKREACKQLVSLPFVETLPWGYRYQSLTREGLLKRYVLTQPELLQMAARLAALAYKAREGDKKAAIEALFCCIVAGNQQSSIHLLDKLQEEACSHQDWYYISNLLQIQDEAEQLPFVQPLPRTEEHWLLRGLVHRAQGKLETAIADCSSAILINSESALAYVNRGTLYAEQQHYEQALADYNLALRFDPTMAQAYINRGIIYTKQKRFSDALQDFDSTLQFDPNNAFVYCNKGSVLNELEQYEEAMAAYEQALRIDPHNDEAYRGIINILYTPPNTHVTLTDSRASAMPTIVDIPDAHHLGTDSFVKTPQFITPTQQSRRPVRWIAFAMLCLLIILISLGSIYVYTFAHTPSTYPNTYPNTYPPIPNSIPTPTPILTPTSTPVVHVMLDSPI